MAGEIRTYDHEKITLSLDFTDGPSINLTIGLVDSANAIQENKDGPRYTRRGDRQGNYVRNRSPKQGGNLTLTYVAESPTNDELSAALLADHRLGVDRVGTMVMKDLRGTTLVTYKGAFIEDDPAIAFGDTAADRVWVIGYADREGVIGGAPIS